MTGTEPEFRKVTEINEIPLDKLVNKSVTIGYVSPGKCRRYYTANLLEHNQNYLYMGSGDNHLACCRMSDLHWFGRIINGVHRFKKSEIDVIATLEERLHYNISRA